MKQRLPYFSLTALLGSVAWAGAAHARPGDGIRLTASGIMSSGLIISIDLETGQSIKKSTPYGSVAPGQKIEWKENRRLLSAEELQMLKAVVNRGLDEGFRSKACNDRDEAYRKKEGRIPAPPPPTLDSIVTFSVELDGRGGSAPGRGCESPAYDAVWKAAYELASVGETAPAK